MKRFSPGVSLEPHGKTSLLALLTVPESALREPETIATAEDARVGGTDGAVSG